MIATHVLSPRTAAGDLAFAQELAGGRASALFAVLAGVSIALMTGGRTPPRGGARVEASVRLLVRALLITALGLPLAALDTGLAIILSYYGVLFALAIPVLGLRAPALLCLAAAWVVIGPVLTQVVRPWLPARGFGSPGFAALAEPGHLLSELLFTGYYPAVPWLAYLLLGIGVGRLDLHRTRTQVAIAAAGAVAAGLALVISDRLTRRPGVLSPLLDSDGARDREELLNRISGGMYGQTPVDGPWQWLTVVAPHSSTPFDLAHTMGSALVVIGVCLLLVERLPWPARRAVAVLGGAGTMTLTLYSLHVVMHSAWVWPEEVPESFGRHVLVVLALGAAFVACGRRGPLETAVGAVSRSVARPVSRAISRPVSRRAAGRVGR